MRYFHLAALPLAAQAFSWGTATASYQIEGARSADGRQPSVWDAFDTAGVSEVVKAVKPNGDGNIYGDDTGAVADNDYVLFAQSVNLTASLGFDVVRLSVAWPRVMSYSVDAATGSMVWKKNEAGLAHYADVLRAYAARDIKVALTMFHWDLPLALEEYAATQPCESAWLCPWIGEYFADYANLLMTEFGDVESFGVEYWITLNEPLTVVGGGYGGTGHHAPGRCGDVEHCWKGNNLVEPYLSAKNFIKAHAYAFRAWEALGSPGLGCGMTLNGDWRVPVTSDDQDAATRSLEWQVGLFYDPVYTGDWTPSIEAAVGDRMANMTGDTWAWTDDERTLIKGAHDSYFFMNHYTTYYVRAEPDAGCGYECDAQAETSGYSWATGEPIGTPSSNMWLFNYGAGIGELVRWYDNRWPNMTFMVTENGWGNLTAPTVQEDVQDFERCSYYRDYIGNLSAAAADGVDVGSYFAWSLMDNYEWADGFSTRFGLTYVDYDTQERTPKMSAAWFAKYITPSKGLPDPDSLPYCDAADLGFAPAPAAKKHYYGTADARPGDRERVRPKAVEAI